MIQCPLAVYAVGEETVGHELVKSVMDLSAGNQHGGLDEVCSERASEGMQVVRVQRGRWGTDAGSAAACFSERASGGQLTLG